MPIIQTKAIIPSREVNRNIRPLSTRLEMPTPRISEAIQTWGIRPKLQIISSQEEMFSPCSRTGIPIKVISRQIRLRQFRTYSNHRVLLFHRNRKMWGLMFINNKAYNKTSTQLQNPGRVFLRAKFIRHEGVRLPLNSRPLSQMRGMIQTWRYHPPHPEPGVMFLQVILRNQVMTFKVTQSGLDAAAQGLLWSDVTTLREEHEIG